MSISGIASQNELRASLISSLALFAGIWGLVFSADPLLYLSFGFFIYRDVLLGVGLKVVLLRIAFMALILLVGFVVANFLGGFLGPLSFFAKCMILFLLMESGLHVLGGHGNNHRLVENLVKSGEWEKEFAELRATTSKVESK